jgi:hypothetical protein
MKTYRVEAHWDEEDRVWWAESKEMRGLVAEAATVELLSQVLQDLVPGAVSLTLPPAPSAARFQFHERRRAEAEAPRESLATIRR